ncbi:MAG: NAD(P)-dependent oxidoreductase [Planctomycetota bacterium]
MALKVHVTGGEGFLGRYIIDAMGEGYELDVTDVSSLDVTDQAATTKRLAAAKPDVVCHLAGLTGAGASLEDPRRFFEVNLTGTVNVLEACRQAGVGGFVFLSSLTVHGQTESGTVDEDSPRRPRHPYAGSKAAAELVVETYARCHQIRSAILRPTLIAGEGQRESNAVTEFLEQAGRGEAIELFGDGSHQREWLHPSDVGTAVRAAVDYVAATEDLVCEAFLVSSGAPVSMADVAKTAIAVAGRGELRFLPSTRQAFNLCTATDKARRLLRWSPDVDFVEIVRRCAAAQP